MGNFKGHLLPGVMFIMYGVWWIVGVLRCFFRTQARRQRVKPGERVTICFNVHDAHNLALHGIICVSFPLVS